MVSEASKSRWLLIVLIVSLALNLFLGGLMFGRWVSGPRHHRLATVASVGERGATGEPGRILHRMASTLPPEHRPAFEAAIAKHRERVVQAAGQAREAREQAREVLRKEPFDRAALDRAFETVRASNVALQTEIQAAISEGAAGLPPEARQLLADWRAQGRGR
jgi:uncharacterized membrane protein